MKWALVIGAIGFCLSPALGSAWEDSEAKPVAALEQMDEQELVHEAQRACVQMSLHNKTRAEVPHDGSSTAETTAIAAKNYLDLVGLVARKQHGEEMPRWFHAMDYASGSRDTTACVKVGQQFQTERLKKKLADLEKKGKNSPPEPPPR